MQPWSEDADALSLGPLPFVLDDHPDRVPDRSAARALEVVHIFGDSVVDVRHIAKDTPLTLGNPGDLMVPADLVDPTSPVATHDGDAWVVHLDPRWDVALAREGRREVLTARASQRLDDGDQLIVGIGAMTLVLREVWRSRRLPVPLGAEVDVPFLLLSGVVAAVASITGYFGTLLPAPERDASAQLDAIREVLVMRLPPPPDVQVGTRNPEKHDEAGAGGTPARTPRPNLHNDHRPPAGAPKPMGILGALADQGLQSVFGAAGLPSAMLAGVDTLQGSTGAGLAGPGLSGRCVGQDCLGFGTATGDGIGDVGTRGREGGYGDPTGTIERSKASAKLVVDDPITIGNIDAGEIDRVVKRHLSEIRYCYQRELQKKPNLQGKVKMKFTIAHDGSVSSASPSLSTVGDAAVDACLSRTFFRMTFPQPQGGGIAIVSYPFLFSPG